MEKIARSIPVTRPYKLPLESNKWGGAYFDGVNARITTSNLALGAGDFSIIAHINPGKAQTGFPGNRDVIYYGGSPGIQFYIQNNKLSIQNPPVFNTITSSASIYNGKISNVAVTSKTAGNSIKLYVNSNLLGSGSFVIANSTSSIIGNDPTPDWLLGNLYEIAIFAVELSQKNINLLMNGRILPTQFDCRLWHDYRLGHARDLSGNGNHEVINGNVRFV